MVLTISCNELHKSVNEDIQTQKEEFEIELYYADTVEINKTYRGLLLYNADSDIDSITSKLEHKKDTMRIFALYLNYSKRAIGDSFQEIIDDPKSELFSSYTPDSIYYEYTLKETGNQFIDFVLRDEILYPTFNKDYPINIKKKYKHIRCPVYVTDEANFKNKIGSLIRSVNDNDSKSFLYNLDD